MSENHYKGQDAESLRHTLSVLDTVVAATDRHPEVSGVIAAAQNRHDARTAVAALLDVDDEQADIVLNLQWYRLTAGARAELRRHREQVLELLAEPPASPRL